MYYIHSINHLHILYKHLGKYIYINNNHHNSFHCHHRIILSQQLYYLRKLFSNLLVKLNANLLLPYIRYMIHISKFNIIISKNIGIQNIHPHQLYYHHHISHFQQLNHLHKLEYIFHLISNIHLNKIYIYQIHKNNNFNHIKIYINHNHHV